MKRQVFRLCFGLCFIPIILNLAAFSFGESNIDVFFKTNQAYQDVKVKDVISTDSFILDTGEKIKLIGLKSPEIEKSREPEKRDKYGFVIEEKKGPITPVEEEAFTFVQELLKGKHVRLEFDSEKQDSHGKTYAYAFLIDKGTFVNTEILRMGYANLQISPPNTKYEQQLRQAYKEAHDEKRGLQND